MADSNGPDISVVLATPKGYDSLRRVMHCLREQTIRDRIEVIIVTPDPVSVALEAGDCDAFHIIRVVECGGALNMAAARAVGIRSANAPWVWIGEDHSFPDARTAASLLKRHRDGYAVVGPQMANANPGSTLSWVSFASAYAPFARPARGGETDSVAGHNASYAVACLIALGDELPVLLAAEAVLHWQLRASGERVFLEPRATLWQYLAGSPIATRLRGLDGHGVCGGLPVRNGPGHGLRLGSRDAPWPIPERPRPPSLP